MTALATDLHRLNDIEQFLRPAVTNVVAVFSHASDSIVMYFMVLGKQETMTFEPDASPTDITRAIWDLKEQRVAAVGPEFAMAHALSTRHNYASDHMNQDPWS